MRSFIPNYPRQVLDLNYTLCYEFVSLISDISRSQWPRGLRHELSSSARTLGSWVRVVPEAWIFVYVYSVFVLTCIGSDSATG
jgi:hypothetical protein